MPPIIRLVLLASAIIFEVHSLKFEDPKNDIITFYPNDGSSSTQKISMDEDNPPDVVLVIVSEASGDITVSVTSGGTPDLLKITTNKIGEGRYEIKTALAVDYDDVLPDHRFLLNVVDSTGIANYLNLIINNIDNKSPTLEPVGSCSMDENKDYSAAADSECVFKISDPDGFLAKMDFTDITGTDAKVKELFEFKYQSTPADTDLTQNVYLTLKSGQKLDYETASLYTFQLHAKDGAKHDTTPREAVDIVVSVNDMPDVPPNWLTFPYSLQVMEKKPYSVTIKAKDGDYGLNWEINYKIEDDVTNSGHVKIDAKTGLLTLDSVNRDQGDGIDQIVVNVIAFEIPGEGFSKDDAMQIKETLTFIIQDKDDNIPEISVKDSSDKLIDIRIDENTYVAIDTVILVDDIDLGVNAMYSTSLSKSPDVEIDYSVAFEIVPTRGYKLAQFNLVIADVSKLDYDSGPDWRVMKFDMHTSGDSEAGNKDSLPITITLNPINDKLPVFDAKDGNYEVDIYENIKINQPVETVHATDADLDIDEVVTHAILGTYAQSILNIDPTSGDVTTKIDNAFDYEKQTEIFVQIQAEDTGSHKTTAQLTINVKDVNDENPRIKVESSTSIDENQEDGTVLSEIKVSATDDDSNPNLVFYIDWEASNALKNSQEIPADKFEPYKSCITVDTIKDDTVDKKFNAQFKIKDVVERNTPDYELFDSLNIMIMVHDENTQEGTGLDSASLTINIKNINDLPPVFSKDAGNLKKSVSENSIVDSPVGQITATDEDNLLALVYSMTSKDDTTKDWIKIDPKLGSLSVGYSKIDCDDPRRDDIRYTVSAFDGVHTASVDIVIEILDVNDSEPQMDGASESIPEQSPSGTLVYTLKATDKDRDAPNNEVSYAIAPTSVDVTDRFSVDGDQLVVDLKDSATLDRDNGPAVFNFQIAVTDKGTLPHKITPDFKVTLTDINNQVPTVVTDTAKTVKENLKKGEVIDTILAEDKDGEGPNSEIDFQLTKIQRFSDENYEHETEAPPEDLFLLATDDQHTSKKATLTANYDLEKRYGYYKLTIKTRDFGTDPKPQEKLDNMVKLQVARFNFKVPTFVFPVEDFYYLTTVQDKNSRLKLYNDDDLPNIQATDNQEEKYNIQFSLPVTEKTFQINNADTFGNSQAQLQLKIDDFDTDEQYTVTITANVNPAETQGPGESIYTAEKVVTFGFHNQKDDPTFDDNTLEVEFKEESTDESSPIPEAQYPEHIDLPKFYYLLEGDRTLFDVNSGSGKISLKNKLDFETVTSYDLTIQAARRAGAANSDAPDSTRLKVHVQVLNENDNEPVFEKDPPSYYAGILMNYVAGTPVLTPTATDLDIADPSTGDELHDKLSYHIDESSIQTTGTGLGMQHPFNMREDNGEITLNFGVTTSMAGYFTFTVNVHDLDETHLKTATVKLYIVSEDDRVKFKFQNPLAQVQSQRDDIKAVLDAEFEKYQSNTENPSADTDSSGVQMTNRTVTPTYFIDTDKNEPISGDVILKQLTDITVFARLNKAFLDKGLILLSFGGESKTKENLEEVLRAWLIGVSVVLGALCLILLMAFLLKTRALKQRINNLSNTKFGSQESGLNRAGVAAPTTNKHAVEGSNPVYNTEVDNHKEPDRVSVASSGDSDLIGVEDNPEFEYDNASYEEEYETKDEITT